MYVVPGMSGNNSKSSGSNIFIITERNIVAMVNSIMHTTGYRQTIEKTSVFTTSLTSVFKKKKKNED
jgi:hypothetical protein